MPEIRDIETFATKREYYYYFFFSTNNTALRTILSCSCCSDCVSNKAMEIQFPLNAGASLYTQINFRNVRAVSFSRVYKFLCDETILIVIIITSRRNGSSGNKSTKRINVLISFTFRKLLYKIQHNSDSPESFNGMHVWLWFFNHRIVYLYSITGMCLTLLAAILFFFLFCHIID